MNYELLRSSFQSGDIAAFTHRRLRSWYDFKVWCVRVFTASKYSHVGLIWVDHGRVWLLEAVTPKVRIVPLSLYAEDGFDWISLDRPMTEVEVNAALSEVGVTGYSQGEAILAWFKRLTIVKGAVTQCCKYVILNRRLSGVELGPVATPPEVVDTALNLPGAYMCGVKG